jgi:RNA methyltransferase, TrmH family
MARRILITSSSNPRLKSLRRLRRCPGRDGVFLVEGYRQVASALEAGARVRELYLAEEFFLGTWESDLALQADRASAIVVELSARAFQSISSNVRPDGIAAVVERWPTGLDRLRLPSNPLILVAEAVERPGNLGTIVRSACGGGVDALVICDACTDAFHPGTVRGSVGTLFKLPVAQADTRTAISWLRARRVRIVVATPNALRPYWDTDLGAPTALVVGNERHGVSRPWLDASDETISIPMPGPADSLKVAVAAGVVLFEAARQRALDASGAAPKSRGFSPA